MTFQLDAHVCPSPGFELWTLCIFSGQGTRVTWTGVKVWSCAQSIHILLCSGRPGAHVRSNPEANARVHGPHATPDEILTFGDTAARPPPEFNPLHQLLQVLHQRRPLLF